MFFSFVSDILPNSNCGLCPLRLRRPLCACLFKILGGEVKCRHVVFPPFTLWSWGLLSVSRSSGAFVVPRSEITNHSSLITDHWSLITRPPIRIRKSATYPAAWQSIHFYQLFWLNQELIAETLLLWIGSRSLYFVSFWFLHATKMKMMCRPRLKWNTPTSIS